MFHFDVTGQVAKSTHAGLLFLRAIRLALPALHVWPFDGWNIASGTSALVDPRLWAADYPNEGRTQHQQDGLVAALWLRDADRDGRLTAALQPELGEETLRLARHEGSILGVVRRDVYTEEAKHTECSACEPRRHHTRLSQSER